MKNYLWFAEFFKIGVAGSNSISLASYSLETAEPSEGLYRKELSGVPCVPVDV